MPDETVAPEEWPKAFKLFDNGEYSVMSDGGWKLGSRWNTSSKPFALPNMTGYARTLDGDIWHIVPPFLEIPILHVLLNELAKDPGIAINPADKILPEIIRRVRKNP